ncbi:MAG TPA: hypothetical protein VFX65_03140, partial [Candidatus Limnocylindrales bacterium]|nr:hypothetical protein [Candidatus Limnocylindrales bacterium]
MKTFTESGGSVSAHTISFISNVNDHLTDGTGCANFAACTSATGGSAALTATFNDTDSNATDSPTVRTSVASGTQLTASVAGAVTIASNVKQKAKAETLSVAISAGFAGGAANARAVAAGSTASSLSGTIVQAGTVNVTAHDDITVRSHAENISGALLASAAFSLSTTRIGDTAPSSPPTVAAYVGAAGRITATGNVVVSADATTSSLAEAELISGAIVGTARSADVSATTQPTIRAYADGGAVIASQSGNVSLIAAHNYDLGSGAYLTNRSTDATAGSYGGSLLVSLDVGSDIDATASADVEASVKSGATLRAGNTVNVVARSRNVASARFESVNIGGVAISAGADPTAITAGKTAARLLGNVIAADNTAAGATSVIVLADAQDYANARIQSTQGGGVSVGDSASTSNSNPEVSVELGASGSKVRTSAGISAKGTSAYDSDATSGALSIGAVSISSLDATATADPKVTVTVNDGASFTAGGLIELFAAQNQVTQPLSDGTFDASDACPLNASSPGCVDTSNGSTGNSITFSLPHGMQTGEVVTYDAVGQTTLVGGLGAGRSYGVIVLGGTSVQLGAEFQGGSVDVATDTITFARTHNLQSGDLVRYFGANITGLVSGNQYRVYVVDEIRIKLQDPAVNRDTEVVYASSIDATTVSTDNIFANGDPVTYHAPLATAVFNSLLVDAQPDGSGFVTTTDVNGDKIPATQNNDYIYIAYDTDGDGNVNAHLVQTGDAIVYSMTGGRQLFYGGVQVGGGGTTLTRTNGSFLTDGFANGNTVRILVGGTEYVRTITVNATIMTLSSA